MTSPFGLSAHFFPTKNESNVVNQKEYASVLGSWWHATHCTKMWCNLSQISVKMYTKKSLKSHSLYRNLKFNFSINDSFDSQYYDKIYVCNLLFRLFSFIFVFFACWNNCSKEGVHSFGALSSTIQYIGWAIQHFDLLYLERGMTK